LLWVLLLAMWLVLYRTFDPGQVILGSLVALVACHALALLQEPYGRVRRPWLALQLLALVFLDVVRSNIAVARIVLHRGTRGQTAAFLDIPLQLRNPAGLAALACIITSTPGTAWAGYDSRSGVLTMHILDLVDEETWMRTIKERYEARLMEIFE
jgi:multicomponent K+:H+ antiporter subunit E